MCPYQVIYFELEICHLLVTHLREYGAFVGVVVSHFALFGIGGIGRQCVMYEWLLS